MDTFNDDLCNHAQLCGTTHRRKAESAAGVELQRNAIQYFGNLHIKLGNTRVSLGHDVLEAGLTRTSIISLQSAMKNSAGSNFAFCTNLLENT